MNRLDLLDALKKAQRFLHAQDFIPILQHFCFEDGKIIAYNDNQGIVIEHPSDLNLALPGQMLIKMLMTMEKDVEINLVKGLNQVEVKSGRTKLKLPYLGKDEFVFSMPDISSCQEFSLNDEMIKGIEKCLISSNNSPYSCKGISWIMHEGSLNLYSTDSITLSKYHCSHKHKEIDGLFITPVLFCEAVVNIYNQNDAEATLYLGDDFAMVIFEGDCKITTRLFETKEAPEYENAIKSCIGNGNELQLFEAPSDLIPALSRAELLCKLGDTSNFDVSGKTIHIQTKGSLGRSSDFIEVPFDLGIFEFQASPEIILRGLKQTDLIGITDTFIVMQDHDSKFLHLINTQD